jgi:hypothetical protein
MSQDAVETKDLGGTRSQAMPDVLNTLFAMFDG